MDRSKAAQDAHRETLLVWVSASSTGVGSMSLFDHRAIFDAHAGPKREPIDEAACGDKK